ncbi:pyridoxal phosphate-dependent transferase [Lanmaoa asiatica]|nr:pyridoxal phosphate-dependent transferase [Lanmaoa asiatica]
MTATKSPPQQSVDATELYKTAPPAFGHDVLALFGFEPNYVNLNHGSYGSLPLPVRAFCDELTDEVESNPDRFIRVNCINYLTRVRERVAKLIGAETDECVIVNNTSHGLATVLRNFIFNEGDILVGATTTYGSVSQTLKYLADLPPHPTLSTFNLQFPTTRTKIVQDFEEHIKQLTKVGDVTEKRKIIALIDTIASNPGVLLPWKEMVAICREAGVISVVDGAHSIGQELDINLSEAQPDFWVSNCHKWLFSKRGSAALYVPKRNQHFIKSSIPTPVTYNSPHDDDYKGPQDFAKLFEWTGTIDYVPLLSISAAIDFREWLGGEHKINEYTHALAITGGKHLAERLGTSIMDPDGNLTLNMVNVELPVSGEIASSDEVHQIFVDVLLLQWQTYAAAYKHNGKWWVRCSVQIWNEISDFDVIANALKDACAKGGPGFQYLDYQTESFVQQNIMDVMAREDIACSDLDAFYKTTPPPFGHGLRKFFGFDSRYSNMNNGKSAPQITIDIEANPDKFYRLYASERMGEARVRVAKMIGAEPEECVFVTNASMGITTILRNFEWHEEDIILKTSITCGAVAQLIEYICDILPSPTISTFELHFPISRDDIIQNFRAHVQRLLSEQSKRNRHGKIVAVIDTIASNPGVSLPWKQMVSICKDLGIWTAVDAAHSIGQE